MKKYEISLYDTTGKKYNSGIIKSDYTPDFNKMASMEKSNTKNFSYLTVIINDEEVRRYQVKEEER